MANSPHLCDFADYCNRKGLTRPQIHHEVVPAGQANSGGGLYKVWFVMGSERLELPVTFSTLGEGEERVAKQVLNRLRSQAKGKEKEG